MGLEELMFVCFFSCGRISLSLQLHSLASPHCSWRLLVRSRETAFWTGESTGAQGREQGLALVMQGGGSAARVGICRGGHALSLLL